MIRIWVIFIFLFPLLFESIHGQDSRAWKFTGLVYDEHFTPVPYTHVMAYGSGQGDVTDSLGIFTLYIRNIDKLSFYNLAFNDTTILVNREMKGFYIMLKRKVYSLSEAKIFPWGSSYGEFLEEVNRQGVPLSSGENMGLPRQDPEIIPFDMDEKKLKSAGFLISSPISFLYYNLSKYEKSVRKAHKLQLNQQAIQRFEQILSRQNLELITALKDEELDDFIFFLNTRLKCTYACEEFELLSEVYAIWEIFQQK